MNPRLNFFSANRQRERTGKFPLRILGNTTEARATKVMELFLIAIRDSSSDEEINPRIFLYEQRLKELALSGVQTAINFYRGLFIGNGKFNYAANPKLGGQLLKSAKEVALVRQNPFILINIYLVRTKYTQYIDMEEALSSLSAAAQMDGFYGTSAAYSLANLYGKELACQRELSYGIVAGSLLTELSSLESTIVRNLHRHSQPFSTCLKNIQAVAKFGSRTAHELLASIYKTGLENPLPFLQGYIDIQANAEIASFHENESRNQLSFIEEQFALYFNLAVKKSMQSGPAEISCYLNRYQVLRFNLITLLELNILLTHGEVNREDKIAHFKKYCIQFFDAAQDGQLGGKLALALFAKKGIEDEMRKVLLPIDSGLSEKMLSELVSVPALKKNRIIAVAARKLFESNKDSNQDKVLLKQAARLGCLYSCLDLGAEMLESNQLKALDYYNQAINNLCLYDYEDTNEFKMRILSAFNPQSKSPKSHLNSVEKVEFYLQLCAGILKDMTKSNRLEVLPMISSALLLLFPDENDRPTIINKWLEIDAENVSLKRNEGYFPMFRQVEIDEAMNEIIAHAKQTFEPKSRCVIS